MNYRVWMLASSMIALGALSGLGLSQGQEPSSSPPGQGSANAGADALPADPQGVETQARGPIHEAFASPAAEPIPTKPVPKKPPQALDELPPDQKPEGSVWIGGYWHWDDDRNDFLWVSGVWRKAPPGKRWMGGYWKEDGEQATWVPGFWAAAETSAAASHEVKYMPQPPEAPAVAPPGQAPNQESFYVPGHYVWHDAGYVDLNGQQVWRQAGYAWTPGYWGQVVPNYVWIPGHYRWTPGGYVYIAGYWDLALANRGVLYAPVYVTPGLFTPGYVYTPAVVIPGAFVVDAFFVRPAYCHYYYGDYYGPRYVGFGFTAGVVYSRTYYYDPIFTYAVYEHRYEPGWGQARFDIYVNRGRGIGLPPRTYVAMRVGGGWGGPGFVAGARVNVSLGIHTVPVGREERFQAQRQSQLAARQVAMARVNAEAHGMPARGAMPRTASLNVPAAHGPVPSRGATPPARGTTPPARGPARGPTRGVPPRPLPKRPEKDK